MLQVLKNTLNTIVALIMWPIAFVVFVISAGIYLLSIMIFPPKKMHWLAKIVCRLILLGAGQILFRKGQVPDPKNGPYLYMFNHQSYLDPFIVGATTREYLSAVGGDFQFDWPIWGSIVKRYGAIPIIREKLNSAINSLSLTEDEIKKGTSFLISPEGTRTYTGKMMPFKKGPFHVSLNTGVTIVPIGIIGAFSSYNRTNWRLFPGTIKVIYGEPIKYENYKNMTIEELSDDIFNKIAILCEDNLIKVSEK